MRYFVKVEVRDVECKVALDDAQDPGFKTLGWTDDPFVALKVSEQIQRIREDVVAYGERAHQILVDSEGLYSHEEALMFGRINAAEQRILSIAQEYLRAI